MKALTFTALVLLFTGHCFAQVTGFYGRKAFLELHTASQYPLINNLRNGGNYSTGNHVIGGTNDHFNFSANGVIGMAVSPKIALSLEAGMFFASYAPAHNFASTYDYYDPSSGYYVPYFTAHEQFDFRTITIMPKIEIAAMGGNAPGGLTHQIGIGFTSSSTVDKDYKYRLTEGYTADSIDFRKDVVDYSFRHKGVSIMYALVMRVPINKRLLFNYGFRYNLNLKLGGASSTSGTWQTDEDVERQIGRTRGASIISLQLGFTVML